MIRVAAFVGALVLVFGAALAAARLFDDDESAAPPPATGHMEAAADDGGAHGGHAAEAEAAPAGDATMGAVAGYRLSLEAPVFVPRRGIAVRVEDETGAAYDELDIVHEKPMHLIVVRRDLSGFRHLHPVVDESATWRTPANLEPGAYRVIADFSSGGQRVALGADLLVEGPTRIRPLPPAARRTRVGPYDVELRPRISRGDGTGSFAFVVRRDGSEVDVDPYLGALGHLVILREGDLAYIHAHPKEEVASPVFETSLRGGDRYRLFFQFKHAGSVHTAEFTFPFLTG